MSASSWHRLLLALAMVAICILIGYLVNHHNINTTTWAWEQEYLFPPGTPAGNDFRNGLYRPAEALLRGQNPYTVTWFPPFTILLALPFQLLDEDHAYLVQVIVLVMMNIAALGIAIRLARGAFGSGAAPEGTIAALLVFPLFCAMTLWQETSYGFIWSIERGNFDIYAAFAALVGLWLMFEKPGVVWLQVLCFSIAAHLKIYPGILFVLVLWRHGWKSLFPLTVVNLALLMSMGPANVVPFLGNVRGAVEYPKVFAGNHSAAVFAITVNAMLAKRGVSPVPVLLFYALPTVAWVIGALYLMRRRYTDAGALWLFALSVPMMNLIPPSSNDYKLVLLGAPLCVGFFFVVHEYARTGRRIRLLQTLALGVLASLLALSYIHMPVDLGTRYPLILVLEYAFLWILITPLERGSIRVTVPDTSSADADGLEPPWAVDRPLQQLEAPSRQDPRRIMAPGSPGSMDILRTANQTSGGWPR
jgi:hypothetical protein